jgi:hypothetical protein
MSSVPGGESKEKDGTSMAAPHVARAWTIMKQKVPAASVENILKMLKREGLPITDLKSGVTTSRIQIKQTLDVLADVYAKQSDPSCRNLDVRHENSGRSTEWCGFDTKNWELGWCRQHVDPLTSVAWYDGWEDRYVDFFKHQCQFTAHCAVPAGTIDVPYCDFATAVEKVPQGGTIGLMSGQAFITPITITKPSTLIAIDGIVSIGQ